MMNMPGYRSRVAPMFCSVGAVVQARAGPVFLGFCNRDKALIRRLLEVPCIAVP